MIIERTKRYNVQISFSLFFGDVDVEKIAKHLPVKPFVVRNKGAMNKKANVPPFGKINFRSEAKNWEASFSEHKENFLQKMTELGEWLPTHVRQAESTNMTIVVDQVGEFPTIKFECDILEFMVGIGSTMELDVYCNK